MVTSSGLRCDVCGDYILLDREAPAFSMPGILEVLHCHTVCKPKIVAACEAKDWKMLPAGPIRDVFAAKALADETEGGTDDGPDTRAS